MIHFILFVCGLIHLPGIPIEGEEEEQDMSIKGRLLALIYKIKGPPQKEKEPAEKEQAAPSEWLKTPQRSKLYSYVYYLFLAHVDCLFLLGCVS